MKLYKIQIIYYKTKNHKSKRFLINVNFVQVKLKKYLDLKFLYPLEFKFIMNAYEEKRISD